MYCWVVFYYVHTRSSIEELLELQVQEYKCGSLALIHVVFAVILFTTWEFLRGHKVLIPIKQGKYPVHFSLIQGAGDD